MFALAPPAIPGISAAGGFSMFLQDRSGGTVEFLAQNVKKFVDAARKRPELQNVMPNFSPSVPQIFADVDKEKALKQGVPIADVYATLQAFLGGAYVNDFTRFSRQWKVFVQASPDSRRDPDDLKDFYVRNVRGEMVPLSALVHVRTADRPRVHGALQPVPLGGDHRRGRARLQLGRGDRGAGAGRGRDAAARAWATPGTRSRIRRRCRRAGRPRCWGCR